MDRLITAALELQLYLSQRHLRFGKIYLVEGDLYFLSIIVCLTFLNYSPTGLYCEGVRERVLLLVGLQ